MPLPAQQWKKVEQQTAPMDGRRIPANVWWRGFEKVPQLMRATHEIHGTFLKLTGMANKKVGPMLCDLAPTARGSQDAESRNLGPASFTIFVLARDNELTELTWR